MHIVRSLQYNVKNSARLKFNILGINISFRNPFNNNNVFLIKNGVRKKLWLYPAKIKFYGANSCVIFNEEIPKLKNVQIFLGNNSKIIIGKTKHLIQNLKIDANADNANLEIGENFSIVSGSIDFHNEPNLKVKIGKDCMFGSNIELHTADGHTIYNDKGNIINYPQDIIIGDHVWICKNVSILKATVIPDNCIVANGSILTKQYSNKNRVIAGIPAIQKESFVSWDRHQIKDLNIPVTQ